MTTGRGDSASAGTTRGSKPAASRLVLLACLLAAAFVSPNRDGENLHEVAQRSSAECAREIAEYRQARWESTVEKLEATREGVMQDTAIAVAADCSDAVGADAARCRRVGERLATAGRGTEEKPARSPTAPPEFGDALELAVKAEKRGGYPPECEWAVFDAVAVGGGLGVLKDAP